MLILLCFFFSFKLNLIFPLFNVEFSSSVVSGFLSCIDLFWVSKKLGSKYFFCKFNWVFFQFVYICLNIGISFSNGLLL